MSDNAQMWSVHATAYASRISKVTSEGGEALLRLVEKRRRLERDSTVLDSGAGTGALTSLLHQKCPDMFIVAADISPGMLAVLSQKKIPIVQTIVLDATGDHVSQGLRAEQFTHALSTFMVQFISPPQKAIDEMHRVLQPGGVIGVSLWSKNQIGEPWNIACARLDPDYAPNYGVFADGWQSTQDLEVAFTSAGFVDVEVSETELFLVFDTAEDFADAFITSKNPAFLKLQGTWRGNVEDVRDELVKVTRERFENGKIHMTAACAVGVKKA